MRHAWRPSRWRMGKRLDSCSIGSELLEGSSVNRVWIGARSQLARLKRLAVVYDVEIRLTIVTELYMREMSPNQFFKEFGGGSVSRVAKNFLALEKAGWLRYVRSEGPGGGRRGGVEHFYRATELAVFDYETWALLPYSLRAAWSSTTFKQLTVRIHEAMDTGTFDARPDRHFTWTPLLLDQEGWDRVIAEADALFLSLIEEQEDARLRTFHSKEKPILSTTSILAFESPYNGGLVGPRLVKRGIDPPIPLPLRLAKVFEDELSLNIVAEANVRAVSVPGIHREVADEFSREQVRGRFAKLEPMGWLAKIEEKTGGGRRRSATEFFYRATGPAVFDNEAWGDVPAALKEAYSWTTFKQLCERVKEAMEAGTFDAREDRYLTWSLLQLDQQGWRNVIAGIEKLFAFLFEEADRAEARMAKSGVEPILMTVALGAFESPKAASKAP